MKGLLPLNPHDGPLGKPGPYHRASECAYLFDVYHRNVSRYPMKAITRS